MGEPTRIPQEQIDTLARLSELPALSAFYLAGGTAVAAHLGHRRSLDLDLFGQAPELSLSSIRDAIMASPIGAEAEVVAMTDASLRLRVTGVPVDIVCYPYATLVMPTPGPASFPLAHLRDLAAMKLAAVARRGIRRDFWDLYEMLARPPAALRGALDDYATKFEVSESDLYHVLRALTYFSDAEAETLFPEGLSQNRWEEIKRFFLAEAPIELLRRSSSP